jgi:hypothetical protein
VDRRPGTLQSRPSMANFGGGVRPLLSGFPAAAPSAVPSVAKKAAAAEQDGGIEVVNPDDLFIFLCNDSTVDECHERSLFGAPEKERANVDDNVKQGTTLYLYDFSARTLTGPYKALESPKWNAVPEAWQGGRGRLISAFPVQVRIGACPLMEPVTFSVAGYIGLGKPTRFVKNLIFSNIDAAAKARSMKTRRCVTFSTGA